MGRERAKRDGEVHQFVRLVADGNDPRIWVGDAARVVLLFRDVVDYVLFGVVFVRSRRVHWADYVHLVVLKWDVVLVDVNNVIRIVYPKSVKKKKTKKKKQVNKMKIQ